MALGFSLTMYYYIFFFSSRRRHTRLQGDWSSDVCSSDLEELELDERLLEGGAGGDLDEGAERDVSGGVLAQVRPRIERAQALGRAEQLRRLAAVEIAAHDVAPGELAKLLVRSGIARRHRYGRRGFHALQPPLLPEETAFRVAARMGASVAAQVVQEHAVVQPTAPRLHDG